MLWQSWLRILVLTAFASKYILCSVLCDFESGKSSLFSFSCRIIKKTFSTKTHHNNTQILDRSASSSTIRFSDSLDENPAKPNAASFIYSIRMIQLEATAFEQNIELILSIQTVIKITGGICCIYIVDQKQCILIPLIGVRADLFDINSSFRRFRLDMKSHCMLELVR